MKKEPMKDYLIRGISADGTIRYMAVDAKVSVEEAMQKHGCSATSGALLGRLISAAFLMSAGLKNEQDVLTIRVDGKQQNAIATVKANGDVKGYVQNPLLDLPKKNGKLDVGGLVYPGTLTVIKDIGMKMPVNGSIELVNGEIAQDLSAYFYHSEQIPSGLALGVLIDVDYSVRSAGGVLVQLLPPVTEETILQVEQAFAKFPYISDLLDMGLSIEEVVAKLLASWEIQQLEKREVRFFCDCSQEKMEKGLLLLGKAELKKILAMPDEQVETVCHFCNSKYYFSKEHVEKILQKIDSKKS